MEIQLTEVVNVALPVVTGAIGWLAGRRKQKNDFLAEMQSSIDLLSEKNKLFVGEMVQLREENLKLCGEVALLREENRALRSEIETLNKNLANFSSPPVEAVLKAGSFFIFLERIKQHSGGLEVGISLKWIPFGRKSV